MRDRTASMGRPSPWVARFFSGIRENGRVLDVACGAGRHLVMGASTGRRMVGIDRDIAPARAQVTGLGVKLIEADLEAGGPFPFPAASFDGVVVTNYLWRPILPAIVASVASDGVLVYETFALGNEAYGRPSNPAFLLRPGELLAATANQLCVIAFEQGRLTEPDRVVQRILAVGFAHPWASAAGLVLSNS